MENNSNESKPLSAVSPSLTKTSGVHDVFINIATLLSLGMAIYSFIQLVQLMVDTVMPDQFNCGCNFSQDISMYVATLIVSAGFYFYLSWKMRKDENAVPLHHANVFHQVVVYMALFFSGLAISYSIISILQTAFYYGITIAIVLKLLLLVVVFGSVFNYYLSDIKKSGDIVHSKMAIVSWWIVVVLIVGSIFGAFAIIGSPSFQKEKRFDEERLSALQSIKGDLDDQLDGSGEPLPKTLSEFYTPEYMNTLLDPEYNQPYEYQPTGTSTYDLCATFSTSSDDYAIKLKQVYGGNAENYVDPWKHEAGYSCFHLKLDNMTTDSGTTPSDSMQQKDNSNY